MDDEVTELKQRVAFLEAQIRRYNPTMAEQIIDGSLNKGMDQLSAIFKAQRERVAAAKLQPPPAGYAYHCRECEYGTNDSDRLCLDCRFG